LKIETQTRDDHQIRLIAEVEPDVFQQTKRRAARKISQETKIPGFRPGKAPYDIVRRVAGEETIEKEAISILVDEVYPKAIQEAGVEPYGPGTLDEIVSQDPVTFAFVVPLSPTVKLGNYGSIRIPYEPAPLNESQVDDFVARLKRSYATIQPVERPAQNGDLVFLTVNGKVAGGESGEEQTLVENRPFQVTIQEDKADPDEWPFPGFGAKLIGLSANDTNTLTHTFDDESSFESLRGKTAEFSIAVQSVKSIELPEVNDEFAQTLGEFESKEKLLTSIRENLEAENRSEYDRGYYQKILDAVAADAQVSFPPQALEEETEEVLKNLEKDLANQKMDLETYLKVRKTTRDTFLEQEVKPAAKRRLERSLILSEILRAEKIEVTREEVEATFNQTVQELEQSNSIEQIQKQIPRDRLADALTMEAYNRAVNQRIHDRLMAIARGEAGETTAQLEEAAPEEAAAETVAPAAEKKPKKAKSRAKAKAPAATEEPPAAEE
jgi:trigger factor